MRPSPATAAAPLARALAHVAVVVAVGIAGAGGAGCSGLVLFDALGRPVACDAPGDCAAGFACVDGACDEVDAPSGPPPPGTPIGSDGGVVAGPDGVTLTIPPASTGETLFVIIERASSTTLSPGAVPLSRFYTVKPAQVLVQPATLTLPFDDDDGEACPVDAECAIFFSSENGSDGEPWEALADAGGGAPGTLTGVLPVLGVVVVAGTAEGPPS